MALLSPRARAILAMLCAAAAMAPARAEETVRLFEQEIEAGLLYNFIKYTQWPAERAARGNGNVVVCLLGGDPFGGHLQPMAGRTVNQRGIEIRSVNGAPEAQACSLLYIDEAQKSSWPQMRRELEGEGILTVGNFAAFAESGGMIEFTRLENRINVKINVDAVAAAHLTIESRLLRLAHIDAAD